MAPAKRRSATRTTTPADSEGSEWFGPGPFGELEQRRVPRYAADARTFRADFISEPPEEYSAPKCPGMFLPHLSPVRTLSFNRGRPMASVGCGFNHEASESFLYPRVAMCQLPSRPCAQLSSAIQPAVIGSSTASTEGLKRSFSIASNLNCFDPGSSTPRNLGQDSSSRQIFVFFRVFCVRTVLAA